jgi:iron complex transport system substrate-binding protein
MCTPLKNANNILIFFVSFLLAFFCVNVSFARTVTDEIGRSVNISPAPQRIVSLAPGITETLYALGLDRSIVGVTTFCDWPQAARAKTKIGGFTNPSIEKIVALRPDLILATADGNRRETVRQLEKLGLPVYVTNPTNTSGVLKSIEHIGGITGREKEASLLVEKLQKKLDGVAARTRGKKKPRVFFQLGMEPVITAGRGTLIHEVIERAGGVNVAGNDIANYPRYSVEGIISASPDIIVFAPMVNDKTFVAVYKFWRTFGEVPAVKNHKIYPIDANLINRASPRIFDAVEILADMFYPEIRPSIRTPHALSADSPD